MEKYYLTTLSYNLTKNSPKKIDNNSFNIFPDLLNFIGKNPVELTEEEIEILFKFLNINLSKSNSTNLRRLYSFLKNKVDIKTIIKLREESSIDIPEFCNIIFTIENGKDEMETIEESTSKKRKISPSSSPSSKKIKFNVEKIVQEVETAQIFKNSQINQIELSSEDEEEIKEEYIYIEFFEDKTLHILTGIRPSTFFRIAHEVESLYCNKRGPTPKITIRDSLFLLLHFYHSGDTLLFISTRFHQKKTTVLKCFDRIRPLLNECLTNKWILLRSERPKPDPQRGSLLENAALIIDSTSIRIFKPLGRFSESKRYFDKKNGIYCFKKEVAVSSTKPHFALFISKGFPGAVHDITIYNQNYKNYIPYLKITDQEKKENPSLTDRGYFDLIADKGYFNLYFIIISCSIQRILGYIGEIQNQPFVKITPLRTNMRGYSATTNKSISKYIFLIIS